MEAIAGLRKRTRNLGRWIVLRGVGVQFRKVERSAQREPIGDTGELSAVADAVGSESGVEFVSQVPNQ